MEGSSEVRSWLRCYRCWSQNLEVQVHYEGIHRIDADTGERGEVVDELQEAVVQCVDCMHDQPHLGFHNGRVEPVEDSWERMIAGAPWVASCTVTVDAEDIETCSGPDAEDALSHASFGEHGTREFFTHVRFHKHDEDRIVVHLLVELYARSGEEATEVLEEAARGPRSADCRGQVTNKRQAAKVVDAMERRGRRALPVWEWQVPATVDAVGPRARTLHHSLVEAREEARAVQRLVVARSRLPLGLRVLCRSTRDYPGRVLRGAPQQVAARRRRLGLKQAIPAVRGRFTGRDRPGEASKRPVGALRNDPDDNPTRCRRGWVSCDAF